MPCKQRGTSSTLVLSTKGGNAGSNPALPAKAGGIASGVRFLGSPRTEGGAEWSATGPENRANATSVEGSIPSPSSDGPVDYWLGWRPLTAQDRDRYPAGSRMSMSSRRARTAAFQVANTGSSPVIDAMPLAIGRRPSLRTKGSEVRILSGVPCRRRQRAAPSHKRSSVGSTPTAGTKREAGRSGRRQLDTLKRPGSTPEPRTNGDDVHVGFGQPVADRPGDSPERSTRSVSSTTGWPSGKARSCNLRNPRFDSETGLNARKVSQAARWLAKSEERVRSPLRAPMRVWPNGMRRLPSKQVNAGSTPAARSNQKVRRRCPAVGRQWGRCEARTNGAPLRTEYVPLKQ